MEGDRTLRCACGWEKAGTLDELVIAALEHGRRVHNMEPTRDQVLAMVVDEVPGEAPPPAAGTPAPGA